MTHENSCFVDDMKFHPKNIFSISDIKQSTIKYGLLVLNRPILVEKELIEALWNYCEYQACYLNFTVAIFPSFFVALTAHSRKFPQIFSASKGLCVTDMQLENSEILNHSLFIAEIH